MKRLRGTALDVFGRTEERRTERQVRDAYAAALQHVARVLAPDNQAAALALARLPEQVRGFGHVRRGPMEKLLANLPSAMKDFTGGAN
jgi:indolepyruvate ferredoxin oxidoreductase